MTSRYYGILPGPIPAAVENSLNSIFATFLAQQEHAPREPPDPSASDLDTQLNALRHILKTHDRVIDPTSVEGSSGIPNNLNPFAFTAATDNNPNCLSQSQMLRASD